jgi:hypothetical protein
MEIFAVPCQLRFYPSCLTEGQLLEQQMSSLADDLGKDGKLIQEARARIAAWERRIEEIERAPNPPPSPPRTSAPHESIRFPAFFGGSHLSNTIFWELRSGASLAPALRRLRRRSMSFASRRPQLLAQFRQVAV